MHAKAEWHYRVHNTATDEGQAGVLYIAALLSRYAVYLVSSQETK